MAAFDPSAPLVSARMFEGEMLAKNDDNASLKSIAAAWSREMAESKRPKRAKSERLIEIFVPQVGMTKVLKENNYTMEQGESVCSTHRTRYMASHIIQYIAN